MQEITSIFQRFIEHALQHPEGLEVAKAFDRTLQFELRDGGPFFMEVKDGSIRVEEGDSGLDWQYRHWDRVTCVRTSAKFLLRVINGEQIVSEGFFDRELGFAPRRAANTESSAASVVAWFYTLVRLAHEQVRKKAGRGPMDA